MWLRVGVSCKDEIPPLPGGVMAALLIGYARVSTDEQDLTAQRNALQTLGVGVSRIYVDHGLTGTNRDRPGLREAMAACRDGDTMVVTKLDRLARSLPDARAILEELTARQVKLSLGGSVHDPNDPVGRLLFNVLAMVAEFESDLIRLRTREGMQVAKAKGRLRGKQPKLNARQEAHLVALHRAGEHSTAELGELFGVARSTVYRAIERDAARTRAESRSRHGQRFVSWRSSCGNSVGARLGAWLPSAAVTHPGFDSYLICATPRSGSTLLCGLLESSGVAGRPASYFNRRGLHDYADVWRIARPRDGRIDEAYVRAALAAGKTSNGVFGGRIMAETLPELIGDLAAADSGSAVTDLGLLSAQLGRLRFVHLRRRDVVAQAVSWAKALQTYYWHPGEAVKPGGQRPHYDEELIGRLAPQSRSSRRTGPSGSPPTASCPARLSMRSWRQTRYALHTKCSPISAFTFRRTGNW